MNPPHFNDWLTGTELDNLVRQWDSFHSWYQPMNLRFHRVFLPSEPSRYLFGYDTSMTGIRYYLIPEVVQWLDDNGIEGVHVDYLDFSPSGEKAAVHSMRYIYAEFRTDNDAVLFKLFWL